MTKKKVNTKDILSTIKLFLPEVLIEYFELTNYIQKEEQEELHFYFKEKHILPDNIKGSKLTSKGFYPESTVQDFPIRGKQVYLHITRRRWLEETTNKVVSRNWVLVAKGTRITSEFATFLKEISRY